MGANRRDELPGRGRGQQSRSFGLGPNGMCKCPKCGNEVPHQRSTPCTQMECPKCGSKMFRE
ncbi:MAG: hypothetical protein KAU62_13530 [Candidatus Heimdallarchaeota archaeon]|nr:hydrogenase maturation nickel metallochaperone HypA [Candidatus Heimdallarchaeota archaeon]MCG3257114.1 hypothetical protein [Candidatus Heimdallarchaeota archaeon]MCK4612174.1 hypothetical protein [Candidatus Heimdallarchaeota archaeon]